MRYLILLLALLFACGVEEETAPSLSVDEAPLCTVEVCTTEYGCRTFQVECGSTGGDGPGLPGDGGDPGGQIGEVCILLGQTSCGGGETRDRYWCCSGYFVCRYKYGECWPDPLATPPPSGGGGGGGGGSTNPPCHGSGCTVEQSVPADRY